MEKKKSAILINLAILLTVFLGVMGNSQVTLAQENITRIIDDANLLSEDEIISLNEKADNIYNNEGYDIVIVTLNSLEGEDPTEYADDFYDYNGYGPNGILLLLSMEERDWAISTTGEGIYTFGDSYQDYMIDEIIDYLSSENYYNAFERFIDIGEEIIHGEILLEDNDYMEDNNYGNEDFDHVDYIENTILKLIMISLGVGLVFAFIITGAMKGKLKSVDFENYASNYIKNNSFNISNKKDIFLYSTITKTPRPKNNNSSKSGGVRIHRSSSGRTHGGSRGKF